MQFTDYLFTPILALGLTFLLVFPVRRAAVGMGLVDQPNARKVHQRPVPLIGGIVICIAASLALLQVETVRSQWNNYGAIWSGSVLLLIMGIIDDRVDLRSSIKLLIQVAVAYFVFASGIRIESMFGIFGIHSLPLTVQYMLTMVVIVGVVNAFNLMDGIDGLAAGLAIVGLLAYSVVAWMNGDDFLVLLYLSLLGGLIGFLRFNLSSDQKIFMGDAGSLVLGFILVTSGILLLQKAQGTPRISITLAIVIGVLALPVADSLRVYRRRVKNGHSPFRADKTHFHHLVLTLGLEHRPATILIVSISSVLILLSIWFGNIFGTTLMIAAILLLFIIISSILSLNREIQIWKEKIAEMEQT